MSNSFYASRRSNMRFNVSYEQGEKPCRRVDYRDRSGRLVFRVWSYESDGQADQLMYSALDAAEPVMRTPESFLNFYPLSES